jgi:hypothetical protein
MSFFQNLKILLKKHYIITSSASACDIREPYLYALRWSQWLGHVQTIMLWISSSQKVRRKGTKDWEGVFEESWFAILGDVFDFWFFGFYRFYIFLTNIIKTYIKISYRCII